MISGIGSEDNGHFHIDANGRLLATIVLNYEAKAQHTVRVRTMDVSGLFTERVFLIDVMDANDAPTVSSAAVSEVNEDSVYTYNLVTADEDANSNLLLSATTIPSWLTLTDNGDGTASLTGTPTNADVGDHSVVLNVSDGIAATVTQSFTISVTNVNDAPVVSNFGVPLPYKENQGARPLGNVAVLTDVDSLDFDGGVLTVSLAANGDANDRLEIRDRTGTPNRIGVTGSDVTYNSVVVGTFSGGIGTTPLAVSLNSAATQPIVQALLRSLTFRTLGDTPSTATRSIDIVLTDGDGGMSNTATKTVAVEALNDRPVLALGGTTSYAENQAARILSTTTSVSDLDSANFDTGSLSVRVSNNSTANDRIEIANYGTAAGQIGTSGTNVTYGGAIIGTFGGGNSNTPLLITLDAGATPVAVQALTQAITFRTLGDNPSTAQRTITWQLNDGDGSVSLVATKIVNVIAVNDPPVLAGTTTATGYTRGAAAIALSNTFTITDSDSADFATGRLLVKFDSPADAANRLELSGAFSFSGTTVNYTSGSTTTAIGTRNANGGIGTQLSITFNANATFALTQQLLRSLRFRTEGTTNTTQRLISFNLTDGDGGTSNTLVRAVNVS